MPCDRGERTRRRRAEAVRHAWLDQRLRCRLRARRRWLHSLPGATSCTADASGAGRAAGSAARGRSGANSGTAATRRRRAGGRDDPHGGELRVVRMSDAKLPSVGEHACGGAPIGRAPRGRRRDGGCPLLASADGRRHARQAAAQRRAAARTSPRAGGARAVRGEPARSARDARGAWWVPAAARVASWIAQVARVASRGSVAAARKYRARAVREGR